MLPAIRHPGRGTATAAATIAARRGQAAAAAHPGSGITSPGVHAVLTAGTRFRPEPFGGVVYVPRRDRFFALDAAHARVVRRLGGGHLTRFTGPDIARIDVLARAGICHLLDAADPTGGPQVLYGRSVIADPAPSGNVPAGGTAGADQDGCRGADQGGWLPVPRQPLVINCFATSYCPLRCRYCHADDLMVTYRAEENDRWLDRVIRTARATPAMVAVVTGGEPLIRPERARRLIEALAPAKALVLDTSGVGDFAVLAGTLRDNRVHVRVSMDSADPAANDALRPVGRAYVPRVGPGTRAGGGAELGAGGGAELGAGGGAEVGAAVGAEVGAAVGAAVGAGASAHAHAVDTLRRCVAAGIPCSVQTVVTARHDPQHLRDLRELVVALGVRTWVLHTMVPVGKGGRAAQAGLLPGADILDDLDALVADSGAAGVPLDIRVTGTHRAPNSVLLINARGQLCLEDSAGRGKQVLPTWPVLRRHSIMRGYRRHIDLPGHASRYLNGSLVVQPQDLLQR